MSKHQDFDINYLSNKVAAEQVDHTSRRDWLEARRLGIGSSDIARLCRVAPASWGGPRAVWNEKMGLVHEREDSPWLEAGRRLEPAILAWAADRLGCVLEPVGYGIEQLDEPGFVMATLDAVERPSDPDTPAWDHVVAELKNVSAFNAQAYGVDLEPDAVPEHVRVQANWQWLVRRGRYWVAALIGGNDLRLYPITPDPALIGHMVDVAWRFWRDHILTPDNPPPPDRREDVMASEMHPGTTIVVDDALAVEVATHHDLRATAAEMKATQKAIDARVVDAMSANSAETLIDRQGRTVCTYKRERNRDYPTLRWKAVER